MAAPYTSGWVGAVMVFNTPLLLRESPRHEQLWIAYTVLLRNYEQLLSNYQGQGQPCA